MRRDNSWKRAAKLARERVALSNDMRKAEARRLGARTAHAAEQAEHDLQCYALRLQISYVADDLRALLAAGGKPTASVIATPPPGPPQPDPTTLQLDERRASLAWLLACGTHARGGRQCPFRVFADGHQDLLRYICNLAVAQNPKWAVPRPQPSAMLQLSALVRKQQLELHAERAHSAQLQLEQDDALKEVERSARREASAHAHAAAERRLAQHEKDVFRVEHEVRCRCVKLPMKLSANSRVQVCHFKFHFAHIVTTKRAHCSIAGGGQAAESGYSHPAQGARAG